MKTLCIVLISLILISCQKEPEWSALFSTSNHNIIIDDLQKWGFEPTTLDCGLCVYTKQVSDNAKMNFYLSFDDNCQKTIGQFFVIRLSPLKKNGGYNDLMEEYENEWYLKNLEEFNKDSSKVIEILKKYECVKISDSRRIGNESIEFDVKPIDSNKMYKCRYDAHPNNQKTLTFEESW